ncbi:MAG: amidophosphoribosyltransferase [Pseudomonadota bacterium]|nr:amidophosphoribosyltransferase [Pseudomonadota bacterium]
MNKGHFNSPSFSQDTLHEECGVFGVFRNKDAAALTALGLHALQHRGQEAAGIVSFDGHQFHEHRALGHVGDIFGSEAIIKRLPGNAAVGHNRYSTTGETVQRNIQPLFADFESGGFTLAHNGNLTNASILRRHLVKRGCLFQSTTDTEVIIHLTAISECQTVIESLIDALQQVVGAYSLVAMTNDTMLGVRDPMGIRPLVLGKLENSFVFASESCALDIIGAEFIRDVEPGELIVIDENGITSLKPLATSNHHLCIFEYIYFSRPDSILEGSSVYEVRKRIGIELAKESHVPADIVIPVPDSGVPSAMGYATETKLPYEMGIIRNHYVGRTFIEPADNIRHLGVKLKHNASRAVIEGKRVILVDDSIVRGTTSVKIIEMMRNAGAKEVHMRISSPPTTHSCFYGVDTPERDELIAAKFSTEKMCSFIGADSLAFISIDSLYRAVCFSSRDQMKPQFCDACFTGQYPLSLLDLEEGEEFPQFSFLSDLR